MLLNIYEMLQFSESKADAHNQVVGVLLRHTQRHTGKFLFWVLSPGPQRENFPGGTKVDTGPPKPFRGPCR